jgi:jumonji domain-containing protein 7
LQEILLTNQNNNQLEWAQQAFGTTQKLDAVNLWIGNERAISSMHKDHYENLFYVASGENIFTLCPPSDVPFLYEHLEYPTGKFDIPIDDDNSNHDDDGWGVVMTEEDGDDNNHSSNTTSVRWIAPDVSLLLHSESSAATRQALLQRYPLLQYAHPLQVRVRAGELLYLPSLWFHRVTQSCETVGVNYWYDMSFDTPLWCYFSFLQQLQHVKEDNDEEKKMTTKEQG